MLLLLGIAKWLRNVRLQKTPPSQQVR